MFGSFLIVTYGIIRICHVTYLNILSIILIKAKMSNLYVWMLLECDMWHNQNVPC
jgi:hypothetical protein